MVRRNRLGRKAKELIIYPDPDVSEPEIDDDDDIQEPTSTHEISDSDDSSDEECQAPMPSTSASIKSSHGFSWKKMCINAPEVDFDDSHINSSAPDAVETPVAYFNKYFRNSMFSYITMQTNIYAVQKGSTFKTTSAEVQRYMGILIKMGVYGLPRYRLFWSDECRVPVIADVMSRNRFFDMNKFVHFANNDEVITDRQDPRYDRLFKIRPLLEFVKRTCLRMIPQQRQSVDEQVIPFKGKTALKQYLPKKPKKWGFKVSHKEYLYIIAYYHLTNLVVIFVWIIGAYCITYIMIMYLYIL